MSLPPYVERDTIAFVIMHPHPSTRLRPISGFVVGEDSVASSRKAFPTK